MISGSLAFVLSLSATVISVVRSKHEKNRAIRKELTDTLAKIVSTSLDNAKQFHENSENNPTYYHTVSSILNQQNTFLLHQATYLSDQIPDIVTALEYNTIASVTFNAGDLIAAEKYYKRAVEVSLNNFYRSLAIRSYAGFLFTLRRFEEARDNFRKAISLLTGGDSMVRYTNGITYQMWAWNEGNNAASPKRADELFESAINEFNGIDNESVRRNALNGLQAARNTAVVPNVFVHPNVHNDVPTVANR